MPRVARVCNIEGCDRAHLAKGYCNMHYIRARNSRDMNAAPLPRTPRAGSCSFRGCGKPRWRGGYCTMHYGRIRRDSEMSAPRRKEAKRSPGEWGQWRIGAIGYVIRVRRQNGKSQTQLQHRYIMSEQLGRDLLPNENVHHINGVRDDNRLENLELWSSSQPSGQRVADKVAWAKEILAQYDPYSLR